jgi:hypothetical protein
MVMKDADPSRRAIFSGIKLQLLLLHRAGFDDLMESSSRLQQPPALPEAATPLLRLPAGGKLGARGQQASLPRPAACLHAEGREEEEAEEEALGFEMGATVRGEGGNGKHRDAGNGGGGHDAALYARGDVERRLEALEGEVASMRRQMDDNQAQVLHKLDALLQKHNARGPAAGDARGPAAGGYASHLGRAAPQPSAHLPADASWADAAGRGLGGARRDVDLAVQMAGGGRAGARTEEGSGWGLGGPRRLLLMESGGVSPPPRAPPPAAPTPPADRGNSPLGAIMRFPHTLTSDTWGGGEARGARPPLVGNGADARHLYDAWPPTPASLELPPPPPPPPPPPLEVAGDSSEAGVLAAERARPTGLAPSTPPAGLGRVSHLQRYADSVGRPPRDRDPDAPPRDGGAPGAALAAVGVQDLHKLVPLGTGVHSTREHLQHFASSMSG